MPKQLAGWVCVLMAGVAVAGDKPKEKAFTVSKPVGTWTREAKGGADVVCRLQLTITDDRLTLTVESKNADRPETVRLDADYSINKESVLFGVIDTFDGASPRASEDDFALLTRLSGQPFSVRFRVEDGVLTLKEFKGMGVGLGEDRKDVQGAVAIVCGRYTMAETSHLTPERIHGGILKADPPKEGGSRLDRVPYPTPHYLKHYPTYVPPDPPFPGDRDRDAMLDPTGELKQAKAEEPVAEATRVLPPLATRRPTRPC
jgi:hypothetical protein